MNPPTPTNTLSLAKALRLTSGDVVSFVGGGGKTTAMFRLAAELAPKQRVLTTTTTRIFAAQIKRSPTHVSFNPGWQTLDEILPVLKHAIARFGQVLLIGKTDPQSGKAFGIPPETIDDLAATGQFDIILNEADGSRMRPFKAPAEHEPVIPGSTTLTVPVVGMDVLAQPLTNYTVHRAELVSRLSATPLEAPIQISTLTRVLCHPQGGIKRVPPGARIVPLLNKVENIPRLAAAQKVASGLLACHSIHSIVIGTVQSEYTPVKEVWGRTGAVILAAGGSSRFGSPKQLLRWGSSTLIEHAVDTALASKVGPIVVVLGAAAEQCRYVLGNRPVKVVTNEQWAQGQSTSMKLGLAQMPATVNSTIFMLVDLPEVTAVDINALIERHRQTLAPVVWPEFEGRRGNPVLFDQILFPELTQVEGDTGGQPILDTYREQAQRVAVSNPGILRDIDRPEDLTKRRTY